MTIATTALTSVDKIVHLYQVYAKDLARVREEQRELAAQHPLRPKLDDIEAEVTYLLVRETLPASIVEIGVFHGWSTTWILQALRDNGRGHLDSYDLVDHATRSVPFSLSGGRWTFHHGDVRRATLGQPDYVFLDASHRASFARWYTASLLPTLAPGTPVSIHDVYHHRLAHPLSEGAVALRWLRSRDLPYFTASRAREPIVFERLTDLKRKLRLAAPIHPARANPMIFFLT